MPAVTVIIPSYNLGQYIGETLQSVKDQTYKDWECLIVENGSTDNSKEVIREFASVDGRFKLIPLLSNVGVAAARNLAMQRSLGKYILFLDADDLISPKYMEEAVAVLEEDPSVTVVYAQADRFGLETEWDLPAFDMGTMLASNCLYISCFFRKREYDLYYGGGFDTAFVNGYEDWDFWLSFFESLPQEPNVVQLPEVYFHYRTRPDSRNKGVSDEVLKEIRHMLWEKHKALYSKYFCDPTLTVEYRRMERAFLKASKSLGWQLRMGMKELLKK